MLIDYTVWTTAIEGGRDPFAVVDNGASLAEPGAVAWQFNRKGVIKVPRTVDEDELMMAGLDAGLEDIEDHGRGLADRLRSDRPSSVARCWRQPGSPSKSPTPQ
ncbi:MAG: YebC/PmpR family DNA-binding transcriptional regulator [Acidimicrobiales bacterium]